MRDWYMPPAAKKAPEAEPITWTGIFENFGALECDFHATFGVDFESGILRERTWRWFVVRLEELLSDASTRIVQAATPRPAVPDGATRT